MPENTLYYKYSEFLKKKYGEKVYKLPVNLPVTCPNRKDGHGCIFCAEAGTGFEALSSEISVGEQLSQTKEKIQKKYHADKFIAYFQNYTNTFLPLDLFETYLTEAAQTDDIVEISISTRPDCIRTDYLDVLKRISSEYDISVTIELGLQTVNYHTLEFIRRGHSLAEYINAVLAIQNYGFTICTHVILNLPGDEISDSVETAKILSALQIDIVKLHSLYVAKNTILCDLLNSGTISICSKEEYLHRVRVYLEYLDPRIAVERLFSRIPKEDSVFSNWGTSWWKLQDELISMMETNESCQGKCFHYLNGAALRQL